MRAPTEEIIEAIAVTKGVDPRDLDIILYDYIDVDAIRDLTAHETATWTLSFETPDHVVTVQSDGVILIDGIRKAVWT